MVLMYQFAFYFSRSYSVSRRDPLNLLSVEISQWNVSCELQIHLNKTWPWLNKWSVEINAGKSTHFHALSLLNILNIMTKD